MVQMHPGGRGSCWGRDFIDYRIIYSPWAFRSFASRAEPSWKRGGLQASGVWIFGVFLAGGGDGRGGGVASNCGGLKVVTSNSEEIDLHCALKTKYLAAKQELATFCLRKTRQRRTKMKVEVTGISDAMKSPPRGFRRQDSLNSSLILYIFIQNHTPPPTPFPSSTAIKPSGHPR